MVNALQFYVHGLVLLGRDGREYPVDLAAAPPWQSAQVALVDLTAEAGVARNAVLSGTVRQLPVAGFDGIRFVVGVPFALNHANPLAAAAPLHRAELFWTWQSGYKFLRADLADGPGEAGSEGARQWAFHLGSTGCVSASALRPPAAACAQPNLMTVQLRGFDPLRRGIGVNLDGLVAAMRAARHEICMGDYAGTPACAAVFALTGLDPLAGVCAGARCGSQRLFGAAP
jgi:uncharacterized repeat protein (TIGR04052 family)